VISDELNMRRSSTHPVCKAQRYRYRNNDLRRPGSPSQEAAGARVKLVVTDGVFSMDGYVAGLRASASLPKVPRPGDGRRQPCGGLHGRARSRHTGALRRAGRVDIITGTLGKALGGASGGYTSGRREIIELLRQRSRRTSSPTPWHPPSQPPRSRRWRFCSGPRNCGTNWRRHTFSSGRDSRMRGLPSEPAPTRSCR